jgi:replicative DNA helicase
MDTQLYPRDAEQHVLGAMILSQQVRDAAMMNLSVDDFAIEQHQTLFDTIALTGPDTTIDAVLQLLTATGKLSAAGGEDYIAELIVNVPLHLAKGVQMKLVADMGERRRSMSAVNDMIRRIHQFDKPANEIFSFSLGRLAEATRIGRGQYPSRDAVADAAHAVFDRNVALQGALLGWPSGVSELDKLTGGWQRKQLVTVASRPGGGKSVLLLQSALRAAQAGGKVKFYSQEMSDEACVLRLAKNLTQTEYKQGEEWKLDGRQKAEIKRAIETIKALPIDWRMNVKAQQIIAETKLETRTSGVDMVVIDYLQITNPDVKANAQNRDVQIAAMTGAFKQMAMECNVCVLTASQLNRSADGVVPTLGTLRESGGIEADSDVIVFLHRDRELEETWHVNTEKLSVVRAIVGKHRENGDSKTLTYLAKQCHRFADAAQEKPEL